LAEAGQLLNYNVYVTDLQGQKQVMSVLCNSPPALSLATNASCVFLVAYRLWRHRLLLHPVGMGRSRAQKILSLLIESGTVYCGLQIVNLIFTILTPPLNTSLYVFAPIPVEYRLVTGMYPMFVWLLVHQNRSVTEYYSFGVEPSSRPEVDLVQNVSLRRSLSTYDA